MNNFSHYNVHNALIQLPHSKTRRHYSLSVFKIISLPDQAGLDTCTLLERLHSMGPDLRLLE
jgi:hypothetical protein